jgi:hypothetical protein
MERHELLGGKVHVYKRPGSQRWHCSATIGGEEKRATTGEESLALAKEVAEDWYLTLRGKFRGGELRTGKKFREVAELFLKEYPVITAGHRSQAYLASQERRIRNYLTPFFGPLTMGEITSAKIQEYRIERAMSPRTGKPRARATIHQEIVALRHVLKTARRNNWIETLPDLSPPYKMAGKIGHRAWFSPEEYRRFYEATRRRAKEPLNNRWKWVSVRPDAPLEEEGRRRMRGRARRRTSAPRLEAPSGDQAFAAAAADSRAAFQAAGVSAATALCGCSEIRFSTSTSQTYGSTPARRQEYMSV